MAQQATLEPGSALYELAQSVDLSKVPDKLICKSCQNFLLNGFKTACCEGSICESCNTGSTGKPCPLCKHEPFFSNASKAVRGTARSYLKALANADIIKTVETTSVAPTVEAKEVVVAQSHDPTAIDAANNTGTLNGETVVKMEFTQEPEDQAEVVVQSIEEPKEMSRRQTIDSSNNDPDLDDDIEITVGTYEPSVPKERSQNAPMDDRDQGWDAPPSHPPPPIRKGSTAQMRQEQSYDNSFGFDNNGPNMDMPPNEAMMQMQNFMSMMQANGMNPHTMPFLNNNPNPNPLQAQMQQQAQSMMAGFMANMSNMQNMGMPMVNMPGWGPGMNGFQNFQSMAPNMMGNGAGYNQGPQQYQQNYGDHRPSFNQRNGSFGHQPRGRGRNRGRGRGGAYQHNQQDSYAYNNNMMPMSNSFGQNQNQNQNHYSQGSINFSQPQYDNNSTDAYATNQPKDHELPADDNDFAPGGQEEVEEALGDEYKRKTPTPVTEVKAEEPSSAEVRNEYQKEPSTEVENAPTVESPAPQQEPEEKYIPEAYREDLGESYSAAPPSAPLGPSAKIVAFRERGHGRFPSRGRGSFHGSNGYAPRSPARPVSQHQTNSPTTNAGSGVIGAPTGPRAMREKDAPSAPIKVLSRAESDVGIKIRGTASQPRRDDTTRSATPKSAYDDYGDRDRDRDTTSRKYSKYDKKDDARYSYSHNNQTQADYGEYESSRDKKRRKSRRDVEDDYYENDHDVQDTEMSEPQDRSTSHRDRSRRDREREKEKTRDKYSSSTSKAHKTSSSRRHDDTYDDYDGTNEYEPSDERTSRSAKKSSSKHDDREDRERRDRDHERAEKDKHRKRSRHDREREEDYEDADEEESRRRSRKHKREHTSSRKDRDRDRDRERERDDSTDLGLRITGRSSKGGSGSQAVSSEVPMIDKDPHTLEREARNKERMLKEQQRRENAEKSKGMGAGGLSGGRTKSFRYEDDIERSLGRSTKRR